MITIQRASDGALTAFQFFLRLRVHPSFSATRNLALRERGLARCSSSAGSTGFEVTSAELILRIPFRLGPLRRDRAIRALDPGRSSSRCDLRANERRSRQFARPIRVARSKPRSPSRSAPSSSFTSMRKAWNTCVAGCRRPWRLTTFSIAFASAVVSLNGSVLRVFTIRLAIRRDAGSSPSSRKRRVSSSSL